MVVEGYTEREVSLSKSTHPLRARAAVRGGDEVVDELVHQLAARVQLPSPEVRERDLRRQLHAQHADAALGAWREVLAAPRAAKPTAK